MQMRVWVETGLCVATAALAVLTIFVHDWIEVVSESHPDRANGALEWAIVAGLAVLAIAFGTLARRDRKRLASQAP